MTNETLLDIEQAELIYSMEETTATIYGSQRDINRVGPWVSDSGLTITSSDLAAQIRRQWEGNNAYYTAITPTAMNTLSQ